MALKKHVPQKWVPDPHQRKGYSKILKQAHTGLFWRPGVSKTSTVLYAVSKLLKAGQITKCLVIAPPLVAREVWYDEAKKWKQFNHLKVVSLHGPGKDSDATLAAAMEADVVTLSNHVSLLEWFFFEKKLHKVLGTDMLVIDESHKFRNHMSKRFKGYPRPEPGQPTVFKGLKEYLRFFDRRVILTGTPRPKGIQNLWAQTYIMDEGLTLGRYISTFRRTYMIPGGFKGKEFVPKPGAYQDIMKALKPFVDVVGEEVIPNLPDVCVTPVYVDLPPKARKAYTEMEEELITDIKNNVVKASNAGGSSLNCRQIAGGAIYKKEFKEFEDGRRIPAPTRDFVVVHDEKIKALKELLEEIGDEQVLICYEFQHDKARILKAFPGARCFGESAKKDKELMEEWNEGYVKLALGHPASISHGINIQSSGAFNMVMFNPTWVLEDYYQAVRRLKRRGSSAATVFVWPILATGTVDLVMYATLEAQEADEQLLFDNLTAYVASKGCSLPVTLQQDWFLSTLSKLLEIDGSRANSLKHLKENLKNKIKDGSINTAQKAKAFAIKWLQSDARLRGSKEDRRAVSAEVKAEAAKIIDPIVKRYL